MHRLGLILAGLVLFASPAFSQSVNGQISTASSTCATATSCVVMPLQANASTASIVVTGTFTGTLQFEVSGDGQNFVAVNSFPPNSTTAVTSTTGTGTWRASVAGMTVIRVRGSALASPSAFVQMQGTQGSSVSFSSSSGGGGGDTITSPNSTITVGGTSSNTTLDVAGAAGQILAGAIPALTATPTFSAINLTNIPVNQATGNLPAANGPTGLADMLVAGNFTNTTTSMTGGSTTNVLPTGITLAASTKYIGECYMSVIGSVNTGGMKFQLTGPASPTLVVYAIQTGTAASNGVAGFSTHAGFSTAIGPATTTIVAETSAVLTFTISNGSNAGTLNLQAALSATTGSSTLTIENGASCQARVVQ